jgi:CRP-like cAMP-binding protein
VINFGPPGDLLCLEALTLDRAYCDLWTIGRAVVTWRSVGDIEQLYAAFPRLAFAIRRLAVQEEAMLSERLLSVGRRSAIESVSHLLLELWHRLKLAGLAGERAFPMPLSQEIIGDALGLSTVHVNRTLKALEREGLIRVERRRPRSIVVLDIPKVERLAGFKRGYLDLDALPTGEPAMHRRANA